MHCLLVSGQVLVVSNLTILPRSSSGQPAGPRASLPWIQRLVGTGSGSVAIRSVSACKDPVRSSSAGLGSWVDLSAALECTITLERVVFGGQAFFLYPSSQPAVNSVLVPRNFWHKHSHIC